MARPNIVQPSIHFVQSTLLAVIALALLLPAAAGAQEAQPEEDKEELAAIDTIVVTARKREEGIQDIPIAITAFAAEDLASQQIENISDLQLNMPSVSYTKTNFSGAGNFTIRGVGTITTARSADAATGIHVNTVPMQGARIFETEFFDVQRVETLRGPQGTLYGRNSSAGLINMITKKPGTEFGGYLTGEVGNFDHYRVEGAVTIPLIEGHGLRIAGYWLDRDGFTKNLTTSNRIDDRGIWSLRATLAGEFSEDTSYSVMVSWFEEDDNRSRMTKQACTRDSQPFPFSLGCESGSLGNDAINYEATLPYQLGLIMLGSFGELFLNPAAPNFNLYGNADNPSSRRQVRSQFDPNYEATELMTTAEITHQEGDYIFTLAGGYRSSWVYSQTDYFWATPTFGFGEGPRFYDFPDSKRNFSGVYNTEFVFDQSESWSALKTVEARVASDYDGPLNFIAGTSWFSLEADGDYYVWGAGLERFWDSPGVSAFIFGCPGSTFAPGDPTCHDTQPEGSYFLNQGVYTLHSLAFFGELYYDLTDTIRLTGGVRWTEDKKRTRERGGNLFICNDANGIASNDPAYSGSGCRLDGWEIQSDKWDKWTGKVGIDWQASDEVLLYLTWSTGFKGGGFNPPVASDTTRTFNATYDVEDLTSYEIGVKSTLLDGTLIANAGFFFYDYEGFQVSKIQNRTGINENIDVEIMGVELESFWTPIENLAFDLSVSWIDSEIQKAAIFDPSDPTGGVPGAVAIKDPAFNGSNSVVPPGVDPQDCLLAFGLGPGTDGTCLGGAALIVGFDREITGNEVPHSPEWTIKFGVAYTLENVFSEWSATARANYYWQDDMFGRYFNEKRDAIDSWEQANAQILFKSPDGRWAVTLWIENILDGDEITGHYLTDETSANFTNLFILDPRTYGVSVRYNFGSEDN